MKNLQQRVTILESKFQGRINIPAPTKMFISNAKQAIKDNQIVSLIDFEENVSRKKKEFLLRR